MTERQKPLHLPQRGPQHIGIRAFRELERLRRNANKSMHAYQKFAVMNTEEQKRVYEKFIQEVRGKDQGKLGRRS